MALSLDKAQKRNKKKSAKKPANKTSSKKADKKVTSTKRISSKSSTKKVRPWENKTLDPVKKAKLKPEGSFSEHDEMKDEGMNLVEENFTQTLIDNLNDLPWQSIRHPRQTIKDFRFKATNRAKNWIKSKIPF